MNLKIRDKQGKVKAVLRDDDLEPTFDKDVVQEEEDKEEELVRRDLQDVKDIEDIKDIEDVKDKGE